MKRVVLLLFLASWLVPLASAQDHLQVGAYADYFRISQTKTNMAGLGARAGIKVFPHVMLEAEMSYDFQQAFTEGFTNPNGGAITFQNSNIKVLHGLFGPKFVAGHGANPAFVAFKGGIVNFRLGPRPARFTGFTGTIAKLRAKNVSGEIYPGAGAERDLWAHWLRL